MPITTHPKLYSYTIFVLCLGGEKAVLIAPTLSAGTAVLGQNAISSLSPKDKWNEFTATGNRKACKSAFREFVYAANWSEQTSKETDRMQYVAVPANHSGRDSCTTSQRLFTQLRSKNCIASYIIHKLTKSWFSRRTWRDLLSNRLSLTIIRKRRKQWHTADNAKVMASVQRNIRR